jgi:hypothetical protein
MDDHPKAIGDRTTLAVMLALYEMSIPFMLPFGENTRYDLIVDVEGRLARVQCKTGRLRFGAVEFATCSFYAHHRNPKVTKRDYIGEVDYFAVYCPTTTGVYLIPMSDLKTRSMAKLRVEPPRNNQRRFIRFASDYEIAKVSVVAA